MHKKKDAPKCALFQQNKSVLLFMHFVGNYKCKNQNGQAPQPQIRKYKHGFSSVFLRKFYLPLCL